ncbi:citryl-CoA lyase [Bradyrhizobium vignae]|uniref:citrate synthase (unknown stereospecificity) n=1 Tax=Bradyrhizobium vignae TaxID=1549949 RepID=A0A2U3Q6D9_9BRAD|nr:citryl-CoA lyase [Bradyrhizobium vignae]MBP0110639.1 citryl-CoA lyase [Bradyrhizobium vignae]RXG96589.1 citryl-CoA lyase [Bradyrhizobium vignae]SPP96967.1 Citrate synthase [Bradyrhizobium vignae]
MTDASTLEQAAAHWWRTSICDIAPGRIAFRGYPIEELIGRISFPAMIWLMLRGELPTPQQEKLLQAALVASVDHGPHAPSIAIAQMAVSCGLPLNGAMASAINTLDDVHGGAGEQAIELYDDVLRRSRGQDIDAAAAAAIDDFIATRSKYLPGFGHRFHPVDPRAAPLLALVDAAVAAGSVDGQYAKTARAIEGVLQQRKGRLIPMNIDGATAVIYGELGFAAPLARGIFCLSRAVGILSHAWEQTGRKDRNKGPMPKLFGYEYEGQQRRHLDVAP